MHGEYRFPASNTEIYSKINLQNSIPLSSSVLEFHGTLRATENGNCLFTWQLPKGVTLACRVELKERERLVYILGLG